MQRRAMVVSTAAGAGRQENFSEGSNMHAADRRRFAPVTAAGLFSPTLGLRTSLTANLSST